jgi:hypothetical protein
VARRSPTDPKPIGYWEQRWKSIETPANALIEDAMLLCIVVAGLTVSFLALGVMAAFGYPSERVEIMETLHYWAYLACLLTFLADMLRKVIWHALGKKG